MRKFQHTVTADDTSASVGSGDLEVLATPRLITWCESAAFQVCQQQIDTDHTTVGTMVKMEHIKGSPVVPTKGDRPRRGAPRGRRSRPLPQQVPASGLTGPHD